MTTEHTTLKRHLAEQIDLMHGIVENGPWVNIGDPALRDLVSRHVADAVKVLAAEIGADDAERAAAEARGEGALPLSVEEMA